MVLDGVGGVDEYICINEEDIDDPTALDVADWICENNVTGFDWPVGGYNQFFRPRLSGILSALRKHYRIGVWKCSQP